MAEPYMGQIVMVGFDYAPQGWAFCDGQSMPESQYEALAVLLGTTFGSSGAGTFNLPDLRSRIPVGAGQAPGMNMYTLGEQGGGESVALDVAQIPPHTHLVPCFDGLADESSPVNALWAEEPGEQIPFYASVIATAPPNGTMNEEAIAAPAPYGGEHSNIQPYICVSYCIALEGIFPSQA